MRRLWLPGLCSLVVLGLLVFLGTWQVRRGAWKRAVLADIAAAEVLPAIDMPEIPVLFTKVRVEGMLRFDRAALYGAEGRDIANQPVMGAQLVVPLDRPGHPPLLVLLGWVAALPASMTVTPATIEGYIRAPETAGPSGEAAGAASTR